MKRDLPCLDPDPGWNDDVLTNISLPKSVDSELIVGKHCILELYECNSGKLDDEAFVRMLLSDASKIAGAKVLNLITHKFHPKGITGLALLAESHISIHTWPESKYAAIDVFTCGQGTRPEMACEFLMKKLDSFSHSLKSFIRETPCELRKTRRQP